VNIHIQKIKKSKILDIDLSDIGFCKYYSDHMFMCDYEDGKWDNFRITPFQDINLSPACTTLHYGQTIFEGLKAYKNNNDDVLVFRPNKNAERFNKSAERMCMPKLPNDIFINSIQELLKVDIKWVPKGENNSLYIRPICFALDPYIGIKPADRYRFMVICGMAGGYYSEPVNVKIETKYTRAISGGVGFSKTAANYAAALYPAVKAQKDGFHQLIWTDGKEHKFIEESGTMNIFFVFNDTLVTPPLGDTVLDGVTRDSILVLAEKLKIKTEIRKISIDEILSNIENGIIKEVFGAGTAATIAPIKTIGHLSKNFNIPIPDSSSISSKLLNQLNGIKLGLIKDEFNWVLKIDNE
tara:strand:+ start:1576 stop:2637 length:1062 start_codon:yes stop_codon:yes gene_type:complete